MSSTHNIPIINACFPTNGPQMDEEKAASLAPICHQMAEIMKKSISQTTIRELIYRAINFRSSKILRATITLAFDGNFPQTILTNLISDRSMTRIVYLLEEGYLRDKLDQVVELAITRQDRDLAMMCLKSGAKMCSSLAKTSAHLARSVNVER